MNETTFIYALKEPDTGEIRYIGKSNNPKKRLSEHLAEARAASQPDYKNNWLRSLSSKPLLEIIDEVSSEHWQQLEIAYIAFFIEHGCDLVNGTIGGDGVADPSKEMREKMAAPNRGRKLSIESRNKISINVSESLRGNSYALGFKHTIETRKKVSDANSGENNPFFGRKHSLEARAKMSASVKAHWAKKKGQV